MAVEAVRGARLTRKLMREGSAIPAVVWASAIVLVVVIAGGVLAPVLAPYKPADADFTASLAGMSAAHPFGADQSGQDLLSRVLYGARTSLLGPLLIITVALVLGPPLGILAAWRRGWVDSFVSRATDVLIAFPGLLFAILVIAVFGKGIIAAVIALGLAYTPVVAKLSRSAALSERQKPYISAYQVMGVSGFVICVWRLLPRVVPLVLGYAVVLFGEALMSLAGLSYLGFGVQPPTPDWGLMVSEGQQPLVNGAPLSAIVPAVAIVLTVVSFNIVGVWLADRLGGKK